MYSRKAAALFAIAAAAAPAPVAPAPQYGSSIVARDDISLFAREDLNALIARAGEDESGASIVQSIIDHTVKALGLQLHRRDFEDILARTVDDELFARDTNSILKSQRPSMKAPIYSTPNTKFRSPGTMKPMMGKRVFPSPMAPFRPGPIRADPAALNWVVRSLVELD